MDAQSRYIIEIEPGTWIRKKGAKSLDFVPDQEILFESPPWSPRRYRRVFTSGTLQKLYGIPLTLDGMLTFHEELGAWQAPIRLARRSVCYHNWFFKTRSVQRAYWLFRALRKGQDFKFVGDGSIPNLLALQSFPVRLQKGGWDDVDSMLELSPELGDVSGSQRLAKSLLANYIDAGIRSTHDDYATAFRYDETRNRYATDVDPEEILSLEAAAWLFLRDLVTGLSGLQHCEVCGAALPGSKRRSARTCSAACKVKRQRLRKAKNG